MKTSETLLKKINKYLVEKFSAIYLSHNLEKKNHHQFKNEIEILFSEIFSKNDGQFVWDETNTRLTQRLSNLFSTLKSPHFSFIGEKINKSLQFSFLEVYKGNTECLLSAYYLTEVRTESVVSCTRQEIKRNHLTEVVLKLIISCFNQIVKDLPNAFEFIMSIYKKSSSCFSVGIGASKTTVVEQRTTIGMHGNSTIYLF